MIRFSRLVFAAALCASTPAFAQTLDPDEGTLSSVHPHIPEPMVFDLVRPLGARRGELEVNSLFRAAPAIAPGTLQWAPEVEYTFADGYGVEFELPMENGAVDSYKAAVQGTLPGPWPRRFVHGWQAIGEKSRQHGQPQIDALYLAGSRWHRRWSAFTMTGLRREHDAAHTLLGNYTLFFHAAADVTLGLESNLAAAAAGPQVLLMPQLHVRRSRINVQVGAGWLRTPDAGAGLQFGWRVSREF